VVKTSKGRYRVLVILALGVFALLWTFGCAPAAPPTPTPAAATPAPAATLAATKPVAAATPVPATATPKPVTVKYGSVQNTSEAPTFLAMEKGYFQEQGITMELTLIQTLSDQIPVLARGDLDIGQGGWAASISNAAARGLPVKVIGDAGSLVPGFNPLAITVRKDLYDEGKVRTAADLKGKKVAVSSPQSMSRYLAPVLADAKLTTKDVDLVSLALPDTLAAYANKSIDAAVQIEPLLSQAVDQGLAVRWKNVSDYRPGFQSGVLLPSPKLLENKDLANRWFVAYVKGIRAYLDAVNTGQGIDEVIAALIKYTSVKDRAAYETMVKQKSMFGFNPNGYANKESLAFDQEHWLAEGYVQEKVNITSIVDDSLADYAVQKLGKK